VEVTDRPITFTAENVAAMLADRKTQTRRLAWRAMPRLVSAQGATIWQRVRVGDRFWVREPFYTDACHLLYRADSTIFGDEETSEPAADLWFKAIGPGSPTRPARWLPKWASRLILPVTAVRRVPLQDITDEDAIAESVLQGNLEGRTVYAHFGAWMIDDKGVLHVRLSAVADTPRLAYSKLWNELHGPGAWDRNPEVMAFTFTVQQQKIAEAA